MSCVRNILQYFVYTGTNNNSNISTDAFSFRTLFTCTRNKIYTQKQTIIFDKNEQEPFLFQQIFPNIVQIFLGNDIHVDLVSYYYPAPLPPPRPDKSG